MTKWNKRDGDKKRNMRLRESHGAERIIIYL